MFTVAVAGAEPAAGDRARGSRRHGHRYGGEVRVDRPVPRRVGEGVGAREPGIREVRGRRPREADGAVGRLRHDPERQRVAIRVGGDQGDGRTRPCGRRGRHVRRHGRLIGGPARTGRPVVAHVAADLRAPEQLLRAEFGVERPRRERARQHRSAVVRAVAGLALCPVCADGVVMTGDPPGAHRVHAVRPAECQRRNAGRVARPALRDRPDVSLERNGFAGCRSGATMGIRRASSRDRRSIAGRRGPTEKR